MTDLNKKLAIIEKAIDDKLGYDTEVIEIRNKASFADYFVVTAGSNVSQIHAIADNIEYEMDKEGYVRKNPQSKRSSEWMLMDYGDIIVHIFDVQVRKYYDLERLWKDINES